MEKVQYLESIGGAEVFALFDHLPGYSFFAKNFEGEIMSANQGFYERFGFSTEEEIVGKTDFELFPLALADHFRRDDLKVMETGAPMRAPMTAGRRPWASSVGTGKRFRGIS